ncbi:alpha/beta fold hydrolase [Paenibacillus oryzae]|uniref:alpha/beta fold hydrolase n=1 Tax=Paenibacillus oryzae TaxID=1844972 RepID=UPI0009EDF1A3|nr:hypothetical protein [Paenibacillus oryzae]
MKIRKVNMKTFSFFTLHITVLFDLNHNRKGVQVTTMIKVPEKILRSTIAAIGFPLTIFQSFLSKRALYQYKTQGVIINVGNHNLHAVVTGEGEHQPTVILESGMGGCALDWALVQPSLSRYTKVLSYDRAGFGWSTQTINKPTCENYVTDLHNYPCWI